MEQFTLKATLPATPEQIFQAWLSTKGHSAMTGSPAEVEPGPSPELGSSGLDRGPGPRNREHRAALGGSGIQTPGPELEGLLKNRVKRLEERLGIRPEAEVDVARIREEMEAKLAGMAERMGLVEGLPETPEACSQYQEDLRARFREALRPPKWPPGHVG